MASSSQSVLTVRSSYYCEVPTHKPSQTRESSVPLSAQKGPTSFETALHYVRERIGKNPEPDQAEKREYEILFSQRRKALTGITHYLTALFCVEDLMKTYHKLKDEGRAGTAIAAFENNTWHTREGITSLLPTLNHQDIRRHIDLKPFSDFIKQDKYDDFREFVRNAQSDIDLDFLRKIINKREIEIGTAYQDIWMTVKSQDHLSRRQQAISALVHKKCVEILGLHTASLMQLFTIDRLIEGLRTKGPFVVCGHFSKRFYERDPVVSHGETVAGRPVYYFQTGSSKQNKEELGVKSVVIIGAKEVEQEEDIARDIPKKTKGFIYYIDPSEPDRVYKTSFATDHLQFYPFFAGPGDVPYVSAIYGDAARLV